MQVQLSKVRPIQVMAHVVDKVWLTPLMVRLTLGGFGMTSLLQTEGAHKPGAWVKVFPASREGRAYTIRHVNKAAGTLDIDFVMHGTVQDDGTVSAWARHAGIGDAVEIAGPRDGGFMLDPASTWVCLYADATALPAVHCILASLPAHLQALVIVQVATVQEYQALHSAAQLNVIWCYDDASAADKEATLCAINNAASQLQGMGQVWGAGESHDVKDWRRFWLQDKVLLRGQVVVKGYWKRGEKDFRDRDAVVA